MDIFWIWHFHNTSKEVFWPNIFLNFMLGFKSAILAIFQFCQNGIFEPVHEIQKKICMKDFFWSIMKVPYTKNIHNMFQGQPNPGSRLVNVQTEDFLKKDSKVSKKFIFLYGSYEYLASVESRIRRCPFFWYS